MSNSNVQLNTKLSDALKPFQNRWVALVGERVVAAGDSVLEVKREAEAAGERQVTYFRVPDFSVSFAPHCGTQV